MLTLPTLDARRRWLVDVLFRGILMTLTWIGFDGIVDAALKVPCRMAFEFLFSVSSIFDTLFTRTTVIAERRMSRRFSLLSWLFVGFCETRPERKC
jgi:hypothetical protein